MERLRAAEKVAREKRQYLYANATTHSTKTNGTTVNGNARTFDATVSRVWAGDQISVVDKHTGKEHRLQLSSTRAPRLVLFEYGSPLTLILRPQDVGCEASVLGSRGTGVLAQASRWQARKGTGRLHTSQRGRVRRAGVHYRSLRQPKLVSGIGEFKGVQHADVRSTGTLLSNSSRRVWLLRCATSAMTRIGHQTTTSSWLQNRRE